MVYRTQLNKFPISRGTPSNIIYTLLKSTFRLSVHNNFIADNVGLSIFTRLAVVASQKCEVAHVCVCIHAKMAQPKYHMLLSIECRL